MNITTELLTLESEKDQKRVFEVKLGEINFVDLEKFYIDSYFITNHTAYELNIDFNFKNKDIQKIFYNAFIYTLCEYIKNNKNTIFFFSVCQNKYFTYIVNKCKLMLPIQVYTKDLKFDQIISKYEEGEAEIRCDLEKIIQNLGTFKNTAFTFKRLTNFLKKNELVFLKTAYFTQHQIKLALMT